MCPQVVAEGRHFQHQGLFASLRKYEVLCWDLRQQLANGVHLQPDHPVHSSQECSSTKANWKFTSLNYEI